MMIRLLIVSLMLAGCAHRGGDVTLPLDVRASYEQTTTDSPTLPRCYRGKRPVGLPYTAADVAAIHMLGIGLIEQANVVTAYRPPSDVVAIEPWMPRAVLLHEIVHAGQVRAGHAGKWPREAGAMVAEIAALHAEGWSDDQVRSLSRNNAQTPDWVFQWIRTYGPVFHGDPSDVVVAYQWGQSADVFISIKTLIGTK